MQTKLDHRGLPLWEMKGGDKQSDSTRIKEEIRSGEVTYRHECSDLFPVFDQLYTDTFPDGGVGLLGFNTDFFKHNTLSV